MRTDLYTKIVLTVIAAMLVLIACKPALQLPGVAAEGPLAGVQVSLMPMGGIFTFDGKTGELWVYKNNQAQFAGKLSKLGEPMDPTPPKR